ncbi:MAG: DUF4962 domain-containing protein [Planctomycetes bacterium]|nr:DUF4962 domain-containing protein [Planctomycetota bacterium]
MKEHRHPHPHKDPRQPRNGERPETNPSLFAWKPTPSAERFRLVVARDESFNDVHLDLSDLSEPAFLPEKAFAPGRYFWRWSDGTSESEVFCFEVTTDSTVVEVPPAVEWLKRLPKAHPRIYVGPDDISELRRSITTSRADAWAELKGNADALLHESQEIEEPPFLPSWRENYKAAYQIWRPILWNSRRFVRGAEALALAYLTSGDERYARAACQRMVSISKWDPEGSSHIGHNDEAHMSVIWDGSKVCDWVWDQFIDEERTLVIEQFRRRGQITYKYMHDQGSYGVTRFDSHAGREIVFLALIAFVFHEEIPEAKTWLEWLRPVLCGIWPIWAGDDGAWAEGPSYGLAYVSIMTMFATALKRGAGTDLYQRPFWKGHARWRQWCLPPYAEWIGFGDHSERWARTWNMNADLVDIIVRETGSGEFAGYVDAFRKEAKLCESSPEREMPGVNSLIFLLDKPGNEGRIPRSEYISRVFPAAGWASIRTHIDDPSKDVAFIFRSSPYGAISHSHANNNDFVIHVAGKVMAMPSGYYAGYGSDHHAHWVWHTKSHNCVTLSDAGQLMRSHESTGAVENAFEDERIVYFCGNADASYSDRARRCRRHVIFLKPQNAFVLIDQFVPLPGIASALQWNIHSWCEFQVDEERRTFRIEREGSSLEGHFMYQHNAFFSLSEGWDPPPLEVKNNAQWHQQYHLRFTISAMGGRNLGVVLCPEHATLPPPKVATERSGKAEIARIGGALVGVNQNGTMELDGHRSNALAVLVVDGGRYEVREDGVHTMP